MTTKIEKFYISSNGFNDLIDITSKIEHVILNTEEKNALVNIYTPSSTASIMIIENEPGLAFDITNFLEQIIPINKIYQHDNVWHDGNAYAHIRASILNNSITLPLIDSKLSLSTYQQIVLLDLDNKSSNREIIVTVIN